MTRDHLYECVALLFIGFVSAAFGAAMPWRPALGIGVVIIVFGAFRLWKGRSAILRYGGGLFVAVLLIRIAGALGGPGLNRLVGTQPPPVRSQITVDVPGDGVTMANYSRIETGMSYSEVVAILGDDGEEMSRNDIGGITTVTYTWRRFDGANINAMFQNDRLIRKAQVGLR